MIKEIEVETFLKPMGQGISRPILVIGDDFNEYILKNEKVDNNGNIKSFDCMFLNELLSYQIGCYLDVPMPEAVIAYVDENFIKDDPTIRFAYRFEEGKYFATEKLSAVENNLLENYEKLCMMNKPRIGLSWKKFFKEIKNKDKISNMLAFDIFIANFDRYRNEGNILVNATPNRNIYAIDHGHAFWGPFWNNDKVTRLNSVRYDNNYINEYTGILIKMLSGDLSGAGIMFNALEEYIELEDIAKHSFLDVVERIESITPQLIESWFDNIPKEWYIEKDVQVSHYSKFILEQKNVVRYIIQNMALRNAFTNYRGGMLEWRNLNQKSHTV